MDSRKEWVYIPLPPTRMSDRMSEIISLPPRLHNRFRSVIGILPFALVQVYDTVRLFSHVFYEILVIVPSAYVDIVYDTYDAHWIMVFASHRPNLTLSSLAAFVDAVWDDDLQTRHSKTGFVIIVNDTPIFLKSKRQIVIAFIIW